MFCKTHKVHDVVVIFGKSLSKRVVLQTTSGVKAHKVAAIGELLNRKVVYDQGWLVVVEFIGAGRRAQARVGCLVNVLQKDMVLKNMNTITSF